MADDVTDYLYPLDKTGEAVTNLVTGERHTLSPSAEPLDYHFILPNAAPYFLDSMVVYHIGLGRELIRGVEWAPGHKFVDASVELSNIHGGVYASILFFDRTLSGQVELREYQTLGGYWTLDTNRILEILSNRAVDPRRASYEQVSGKPEVFPPIAHAHDEGDMTGFAELIAATLDVASAIRERNTQLMEIIPFLDDEYYVKLEVEALVNQSRDSVMNVLRQHIENYEDPHQTAKRILDITLDGPSAIVQGTEYQWTITNYDSFSTYMASVNVGNVSVDDNIVKLTIPYEVLAPDKVTLKVSRNGAERAVVINVSEAGLVTPTILTPTMQQTLLTSSVQITVSDFSAKLAGDDTHASTDYVLSTDSNFTNVVWQSIGDTVNLQSIMVSGLPPATQFFLRVRYNGNKYGPSEWATRTFSTSDT